MVRNILEELGYKMPQTNDSKGVNMGTRTYVSGVTFANSDGSSRRDIINRMTVNDKVIFERDPYNPYDSNAVKVLVSQGGSYKQIGFLEKAVAATVSPAMRRGAAYKISVVGCGIYKDRPFCEIEFEKVS